jgi:DNA-binding response OmpR family regulator
MAKFLWLDRLYPKLMKKILVVDDDTDFLLTIKSLLTDHGFVVDTVDTQDDIYKSILIFQPAVILLDIYLNGSDGRNICRGLKNHFKTKDIPIIFCSGDRRLKDGFHQYMAEDFIEKPLEIKMLVTRLNDFCKPLSPLN